MKMKTLLAIFVILSCAICSARSQTNSAAFGERSVYQLTSPWTTDTGDTIHLARLAGKPQVVAMFFTSCQGACPILVYQLQQLLRTLPPAIGTNVGVLLVTFDSAHDTPAVLHQYRLARGLASGQWTLLHGRSDDIRELGLVLGVKYRQEAGGQFAHSNLITVLNADGDIAWQQNGLDNSNQEMARQLTRLVKP